MSHIMKQKIGIKNFNMQILKKAVEMAEKDLRMPIQVIGNSIIIGENRYFDMVTIRSDGQIEYDSMNRNAQKTIDTVKKYYIATASLYALQSMGYQVEMEKGKDGALQITGMMA